MEFHGKTLTTLLWFWAGAQTPRQVKNIGFVEILMVKSGATAATSLLLVAMTISQSNQKPLPMIQCSALKLSAEIDGWLRMEHEKVIDGDLNDKSFNIWGVILNVKINTNAKPYF